MISSFMAQIAYPIVRIQILHYIEGNAYNAAKLDCTCVNNCSVVRFKDHCYNSCPKDAKYVYNGICFESCPPNASKVDEQHSEQLIFWFD